MRILSYQFLVFFLICDHPERTVLYRVLFHYFERFLEEYENRFDTSLPGCIYYTQDADVFALLVRKQLINRDLVQRILSLRHSGFNVHSKIRVDCFWEIFDDDSIIWGFSDKFEFKVLDKTGRMTRKPKSQLG